MKKIITLIMIGSIIMTSCEKQPDVAVVSTRYGDMVLEFYPEVAEKHVDSFLTHARNGYFNGTTFHRVIPGFVIQGGDPNSKSDDRSTHGMVGHVGDGNFHSIILYDPNDKEKQKKIRQYSDDLISKALELEGTITGEHGIGLQKKHYLLKEHLDNLPVMKAIKRSLDTNNIMNPGKVFDLN